MLHARCELECLTRTMEALVVFVSRDRRAVAIDIDGLIEKIYEVLFLIHLNGNQHRLEKIITISYRGRDTTYRGGFFEGR